MNHTTELPQLSLEQPATNDNEAALLEQLANLLTDAEPLPDLRDFAPPRCASSSPSPLTWSVVEALISGCTAPKTPTAWP